MSSDLKKFLMLTTTITVAIVLANIVNSKVVPMIIK